MRNTIPFTPATQYEYARRGREQAFMAMSREDQGKWLRNCDSSLRRIALLKVGSAFTKAAQGTDDTVLAIQQLYMGMCITRMVVAMQKEDKEMHCAGCGVVVHGQLDHEAHMQETGCTTLPPDFNA